MPAHFPKDMYNQNNQVLSKISESLSNELKITDQNNLQNARNCARTCSNVPLKNK